MDYRLALILPHSRQVVAANVDGAFLLPQVSVPLWERPAEQLTRLIEERWRIKSIILDVALDHSPESPYAVIEVRTSLWDPTIDSLFAVDLDKISDESLMPHEREVLQRILIGDDSGRGPFARIGWIDEVQTWVHSVTEGYGVTLTGETLHLSSGGQFCLIRLGTSGGNGYWLKATGEPNTREFDIVTFLAEACPQYLPRLIATRKDWNAWLMEDHGPSLYDSQSLEDFRRAAHAMADLQKIFIGRADALFAACCGDRRSQTLRSHIVDLIAYLDEAMVLQTSAKAPKLSTSRLKEIGTALDRACSMQQELGIPGLAVLKFFAWLDRHDKRDVQDLRRMMETYTDAGNVDRLYQEEVDELERVSFDTSLAGSYLLGKDTRDALPTRVFEPNFRLR
jgi:hypothetical protein